MVGAEAGERASVGMASSWARAESAGARGKRQAGREETETQGREKWARTTNPRKKCRITNSRVSAWTAGAAASVRQHRVRTGSAGLCARTAGARLSAILGVDVCAPGKLSFTKYINGK